MTASTEPSPAWTRPGGAVRALTSRPLIRSGLSLATSSIISAGLGVLFWVLAARQFPAAAIGISTTVITTMIVLSDVCHLGLRTGLVRYVPMVRADPWALIVRAYGLSMVVAGLVSAVFVAGLGWWTPELALLHSWVYGPLFVVATMFWVVFQLEDSALLGLRLAPWVPMENGVFGLLKILLLFPLASVAWEAADLSVFLAWVLPVFPVVVAVTLAMRRAAGTGNAVAPVEIDPAAASGPAPAAAVSGPTAGTGVARGAAGVTGPGATSAGRRPWRSVLSGLGSPTVSLREVLSFSLSDWTASASRTALTGMLPLLVLAYEGPTASAYLGIAYTISLSVQLLSVNIGDALLAEASYDRANVNRNTLHSGLLSMAISAPVVVVAVVAAPLVLRPFGQEYADGGATALRLLLLSCIPNVVTRIYVGRLRADRRMRAVIGFEVALAAGVLLTGWLLLWLAGINGVALAWLLVTTLGAAWVLGVESAGWWVPRLDPSWLRRLRPLTGAWARVQTRRPRPALDRAVNEALAVRYGTRPAWRRIEASPHSQTVLVSGHEGRPPLRLELATTSWGAQVLSRRAAAATAIGDLSDLSSFRALVPYTIEHQGTPSSGVLVESALSGRPGHVVGHSGQVLPLVQAVQSAMDDLYRATASWLTFDRDELERWVSLPLRQLDDGIGIGSETVLSLGRRLCDGLEGRRVPAARIHGNLQLSKALFDGSGRLTGLIDWERSTEGPVFLDWCSLALSAEAVHCDETVGLTARRLLEDAELFRTHQALANLALPDVDPVVLVLLAWLHQVVPMVLGAPAHGWGRLWASQTVEPVLALHNQHLVVAP